MSFSLPCRNGQDGTRDKDTITIITIPNPDDCSKLSFGGGSSLKQFVKPEEGKLAKVTGPQNFSFEVAGDSWMAIAWSRFLEELEHLIMKPNPVELNGCSSNFCCEEFRVVICSPVPLFKRKRSQVDDEENDDEEEVVTLPMKLKVIADVPLKESRAEKEQSCLTKLVRLCGPENVSWVIEGLPKAQVGQENKCDDSLVELVWNEEELAFDGETQLTFSKMDMINFGKISGDFETKVRMVGFRLTYAGVNQVLREIYGRPGQDWRLQQEMLEEDSFKDLAIVSENSKDQRTIKCHKVTLAGASRVFASMLKELATWEEAKTGTIKLPESEDAIRAMLHFIYYGGTDRIFGNGMDVVLELLQAGHKYDLKNLVEVTSFVLLAIVDEEKWDKWFSVDTAMELFYFASLQDGEMWNRLKMRSVDVLRVKTKEERMSSEGFQRLCEIASKIGPVFGTALDYLGEDFVKLEKEKQELPAPIENVTQEEAKLLLDIWGGFPLNVEILLGMTMLAEYCGRPAPKIREIYLLRESLRRYKLGFQRKLYRILKSRNDKLWTELKPGFMEALVDIFETEAEDGEGEINAELEEEEVDVVTV